MNISNRETLSEQEVDEETFATHCLRMTPMLMRAMFQREANDLACGALSLPQFGVLDFLREKECASMHEIAQSLSLRPSHLTGIMDKLVELKMAERFHDRTDRRAVRARITARGAAALDRIAREKREVLGALYRCITPEERRLYLAIMDKFVRELS